ncbi:MAG: hypothetical protein IPH84_04075 [Bacteroidales bacterium]|nr:hypothetical protein [Bacteroidales bacterium]
MKQILFTLISFILISTTALAQINLVGTSSSANGGIEIVKWQAFDSFHRLNAIPRAWMHTFCFFFIQCLQQ